MNITDIISNEFVTVRISRHGAELTSIKRNADQREYLWQGDPAYWKRHSPVLFPIVGSVWNNTLRVGGTEYRMSQHGFARDMDFMLVKKDSESVVYKLESNETTRENYPYDFKLEIGYRLEGSRVEVQWRVVNPMDRELDFQIGAHPAFNYADFDARADVQGYFHLCDARADEYELSVIGDKGTLKHEKARLQAQRGEIAITSHTFDGDALILENGQVHEVTLLDRGRKAYLRVRFDAPLVGLWSPARGSYAPFVCIEPWYGRCDSEGYEGEYASREWMQHLAQGETFEASYKIDILSQDAK